MIKVTVNDEDFRNLLRGIDGEDVLVTHKTGAKVWLTKDHSEIPKKTIVKSLTMSQIEDLLGCKVKLVKEGD